MTIEELVESYGVTLAYFDNELWPRPGIYIDDIKIIFVNKSLSEDAMKKVVYHELGHLEHDSNQYKRRHEQFELQANRNMIRLLLEEELRESDYEFNYVNFMQRHQLNTVADECMVIDEYYNLMDIETVLKQFKEAGVSDTFGTKKEVKYLPNILFDDEIVQYATSGFVNNNTVLVVLTQKRLLFVDKGFLYGVRTTEIPLDMVNGVSYSKGIFLGEISVMNGAAAVSIKNVTKDTVEIMSNAIKVCSDKYKKSLHSNSNSSSTSTADEILKLKELLDAGILTEEEFSAKKKQVLGI